MYVTIYIYIYIYNSVDTMYFFVENKHVINHNIKQRCDFSNVFHRNVEPRFLMAYFGCGYQDQYPGTHKV